MLRRIDPKRAGYMVPNRRVAQRADCYARLPATMPDMIQQVVTLTNISPDGAQFNSPGKLEVGDMVSIKFPIIGRIDAFVIWMAGLQVGVQFDLSIRPQDYLPVLKAIGATPQEQ